MAELIEQYRKVLDTLADGGWTVRERAASSALTASDVWPAALRERYATIPTALTEFVACVDECAEPEGQMWFLYLPFFFDVSSDYAYFAVRITEPKPGTWDWLARSLRPLTEPRAGAIVHAVEELRSVSQVAGSFGEFLEHLARAVKHPQRDGPLSGMV